MAKRGRSRTLDVVVTGDVIVDHHIYRGDRGFPGSEELLGTRSLESLGGAGLLHELLVTVATPPAGGSPLFTVASGLDLKKLLRRGSTPRAHSIWQAVPVDREHRERVWRLEKALGYGPPHEGLDLSLLDRQALHGRPRLLALDDGGLAFRRRKSAGFWGIHDRGPLQPQCILLKMAPPILAGDLWHRIESHHARRTILLLAIEDLRDEEIQVSTGVSWERTGLELIRELTENSTLKPLGKFRHLVISLGVEGALHVERSRPDRPDFHLVFDPEHLEGDVRKYVKSEVFGAGTCLASGIATRLARLPGDLGHAANRSRVATAINAGIRSGLAAARNLLEIGHGIANHKQRPSFPLRETADILLGEDHRYCTVSLPAAPPGPRTTAARKAAFWEWTIINARARSSRDKTRPLFQHGRNIAYWGASTLVNIPRQTFGSYTTVDRNEIETLRNLRQLIHDYETYDKKGKRPLCFAVFGPPGAGKSFIVEQIATEILLRKGDKQIPYLEFNLSQFTDHTDLICALHQVRDLVLAGRTPVIFWDEFDAQEYKWLKFFLAPMQDGVFQEGQITHPVGKCIFVFAGGTSYDYEHFGPAPVDPQRPTGEEREEIAAFRLAKGPDFKSRLNGYLDVLGPNRRQRLVIEKGRRIWENDQHDICFPIRRALLLRALLGLKDGERLRIDSGVLTALLEIDRYAHGARSMEKIVQQLISRGASDDPRRSDVPPADIMNIHADYGEFVGHMNRDREFLAIGEDLASTFHHYYLKLAKKEGWKPRYSQPYDQLPRDIQIDNIAAAQRIPFVLSFAGLRIQRGVRTSPAVRAIITEHLELLARIEHDEWVSVKRKNHWRLAEERNDDELKHDKLVPYAELDEENREKDRENVRRYPDILKAAGYGIVRKA